MRARVVLLVVGLVGCSSSSPSLRVDLRTDLVNGLEFDGVITMLESGVRQDQVVGDQDFIAGAQIARFDDLDNGALRLTIQLVRDGSVVVERLVRAEIRGTTGITVLVTRDCRFVACPVDGGDPVANTCVGGTCVDPGCTDETPELCAMVCDTVEDCFGVAACAVAVCEGVACVAQPRAGACPVGMVCDPERGCVDPACGSCDDANACTADSCVDGSCMYEPRDGSACGPGTCEMDRCVVRTDQLESLTLPSRASAAAIAGSFAALGMSDIDTVQLFRLVEGAWERGSALSPGDAGFGCRLAMRGDLLAVLACRVTNTVVLFRKIGDDYAFEARLPFADVAPPVDEAGPPRALAVGDEVVAVGVASADGGGGVVVWQSDGAGTWSQTDFLDVDEPTLGFGLDVNERIAAGAPGDVGEQGLVVIFERGAMGFEEIHRVSAPEAMRLGSAVWAPSPQGMRALGDTAGDDTIFKIDERDEGWGSSTLAVVPPNAVVDLGGSILVIGRPTESVGGIDEAGFVELRYFGIRVSVREPFPTAMRRFGATVATDGGTALMAPFPMDMAAPTEVTFIDTNDLESTLAPPE